MKTLVVVESPTKAKTIKQYLGENYIVTASFGHIRQLPSKTGSVIPEENFKMIYENIDKSKKHIDEIVKNAKICNEVLIASDPDREGEAIAQAVKDVLLEKKVVNSSKIKRVTYNEVTKKAILEAIENPREIDDFLTEAQKTRLSLDYLFGFTSSPLLWKKLPGSKSAGRVQSVALKMIVERELEILKFEPKEYWSIDSKTKFNKKDFNVKVVSFNNKKFNQDFPNTNEVENILSFFKDAKDFTVSSIETKETKQNPFPPFITSTLQQEASKKLNFSSKRTMQIAQKLYEGVEMNGKNVGLITYMRTDGFYISEGFINNIRESIKNNYGSEYLPQKALVYSKKVKSAQEAHEAIRPTDISLSPSNLEQYIDKDMLNLYSMIWNRTISSQMKYAIKETKAVELKLNHKSKEEIIGRMSKTVIKFDGFLKIYKDTSESDEVDLDFSSIKEGDVFEILEVEKNQHFTQAPARFTEASLIKNLEEFGIGRPSTYSSIITVIQDREYVRLEKKTFFPKTLGIAVSLFLSNYLTKYLEYDFTAKLEEDLDLIASGKNSRIDFLSSFWSDFKKSIDECQDIKIKDVLDFIDSKLSFLIDKNYTDCICNICKNGKLKYSLGKFGLFISCDKYPDCKNIINFDALLGNLPLDKNSTTESGNNLNKNEDAVEVEDGFLKLKTGKYGPYIEKIFKDNSKKNFSIPKGVDFKSTKEEFVFYSSLPKNLGKFEDKDVDLNIGIYGPYVKYNGKFHNLKNKDLLNLKLEDVIDLLKK